MHYEKMWKHLRLWLSSDKLNYMNKGLLRHAIIFEKVQSRMKKLEENRKIVGYENKWVDLIESVNSDKLSYLEKGLLTYILVFEEIQSKMEQLEKENDE